MTSTSLARALLVALTPSMMMSCATETTRPMGPPSASTTELPEPEPYSQITVSAGHWTPVLELNAGSNADFGWQNVNVRSEMWWGPVESCSDPVPQRRFGQQSDSSYAQGPPPQSVTARPPKNEVLGTRVRAYMRTIHVFFEGSPYGGGYAVQDTTEAEVCVVPSPPLPPAPPLTASISGPSSISPEGYCSWYGSVSGGATPYTYLWTRNGEEVSSSWSYTAGTAGGYFSLQFTVWDTYGRSASASLFVAEDANGVSCPF